MLKQGVRKKFNTKKKKTKIWGISLMVKVDLPVNEVKLEFDMETIFYYSNSKVFPQIY